MSIKFGTSGWRAGIANEFTFEAVRYVVSAIVGYLKNEGHSGGTLIVAHDSRFMGERFARLAAEIAAEAGFRVMICNGPTPTPTVSYAIRANGAIGGINFTASHNPPEYQGIKFSTANGAPALPEVTTAIESLIADKIAVEMLPGGVVEEYDPTVGYLKDLRCKVDLDLIAASGMTFAYDPLWGTGRGYLNKILIDAGCSVHTLHDWRDVTFGGLSPEPGEKQLAEMQAYILQNGVSLGLATDGDGDRFGVIDCNGRIIQANELIALLADYLAESRGWQLGVARSVATSHMIDRVAISRGMKVYETPVGFKYIGELIIKDEIVIGGEESAGLSIRGHYPEKDGILACLLAAECVAARKMSLSEQLGELYGRLGRLVSGRIGVKLTDEVAAKLKNKLAEEPASIDGMSIERIDRTDGVKFLFGDDRWMLMRPSGTEPMVRIYAEAGSNAEVEEILEKGRKYLLG